MYMAESDTLRKNQKIHGLIEGETSENQRKIIRIEPLWNIVHGGPTIMDTTPLAIKSILIMG